MIQIHALRGAYSRYASRAKRMSVSVALTLLMLVQGMVGLGQLAAPASAFAVGRIVPVANATELITAMRDLQADDTIVLSAGTYDVERQLGDLSFGGQPGWYFPIWQDGVTIQGAGVGLTTLTSSVVSANGAWASQDFISVWANGVTVEGMTVVSKIDTNKAVEIMGKDFTLRNMEFLTNPLQVNNADVDLVETPVDAYFEFAGSVYFNPQASVAGVAGDVGASRLENVFLEGSWLAARTAEVSAGTIDLSNVILDWAGDAGFAREGWGMMSSNPVIRVENDVTFIVDDSIADFAYQVSGRLPAGGVIEYAAATADPSTEVTSAVFTSLMRDGSYPTTGTVNLAFGDPMQYAWTFPIDTLDPSFEATFYPGITVRTTVDTDVMDMYAWAELPDSGLNVVEIAFAHEGSLPGPAQVEMLADVALAGKAFKLFAFGPTIDGGPLQDAGQNVVVDENGYVTIDVAQGDVWYLVEVPLLTFKRHAGTGRADTAAIAAAEAFPMGADAAVLAYSKNFPDALAASTLAGVINGPILLTDKASLEVPAADALDSLGVRTVYIVGGTGAVSQAIEDELSKTYTVIRLAGDSRYDTARAIADETVLLGASDTEAFLVRGDRFADALAVSSIAAQLQIPVLLTPADELDAGAADFIDTNAVADVYIAGGTAAVSDVAADSAADLGAVVTRWSGVSRYDTAAAVIEKAIDLWGLEVAKIGLASGENFPDALTGGAAMGAKSGLLLLTKPAELSAATEALISLHTGTIYQVEYFGGVNALSADVADAVEALFAE